MMRVAEGLSSAGVRERRGITEAQSVQTFNKAMGAEMGGAAVKANGLRVSLCVFCARASLNQPRVCETLC